MPWTTPTLRQVRETVRDNVVSALSGASMIGNNVLRVMSDAQAGLAHLTLRYIDWVTLQLLPDTAEQEWLDRHGDIWLTNADETTGRKSASYASGLVNFTGSIGAQVPSGSQLNQAGVLFETTEEVFLGSAPTPCPVLAITAGAVGNVEAGSTLSLSDPLLNVNSSVTVVSMSGGADEETDSELRVRVLERIRNPPMGGDAEDYVAWALQVPGVTRAWSAPLEMGIGTVTLRFMCDDLRESDAGFPRYPDIVAVQNYLDQKRPVAVKDFFVEAPIAEPIDFTIVALEPDDEDTRAAIEQSVRAMIFEKARPAFAINGVLQEAQTIYASWVSEAVLAANGVDHFELVMEDHPMPHNGAMAVLGSITYEII